MKKRVRTTRPRRRPAAAALSAMIAMSLLTGCASPAQPGGQTSQQTGQAAPQSGTQPLSV